MPRFGFTVTSGRACWNESTKLSWHVLSRGGAFASSDKARFPSSAPSRLRVNQVVVDRQLDSATDSHQPTQTREDPRKENDYGQPGREQSLLRARQSND